jgi:hypothetical protein
MQAAHDGSTLDANAAREWLVDAVGLVFDATLELRLQAKVMLWQRTGVPQERLRANHAALADVYNMSAKQARPMHLLRLPQGFARVRIGRLVHIVNAGSMHLSTSSYRLTSRQTVPRLRSHRSTLLHASDARANKSSKLGLCSWRAFGDTSW